MANDYLQNLSDRPDDWVVLTSIVDHVGSLNKFASDKVVMNVYNITREHTISTYSPAKAGRDAYAIVQPPIYIDLHLMFMANFTEQRYVDGLEAISRVIAFFQQNPWFNQSNAPGIDPDVDKVTLELESLDPVDVNYIMGMMGTKYFPSAFYKLRMLPFASTAMVSRTYPIGGGDVSETPASQGAAPW